jgi:pimeloyl-ACP methyl ester carboxylesterase
MPKIFLISGLGANETAFDKIGDLPYDKTYVNWLVPEKKETIEHYARRLIEQYNIQSEDILIGLSFGGLLSQKIAEMNGNQTVILISSFRDKNDLRWPFKLGLKLGLYKLQPSFRIPFIDETAIGFLNSGTRESKVVLKKMLISTDYKVSKWSLYQIALARRQNSISYNMFLIIGNADRMVRSWDTANKWEINNGSHFMVYDKGKEVTNIINDILS